MPDSFFYRLEPREPAASQSGATEPTSSRFVATEPTSSRFVATEPTSSRFVATELTRGPWDAAAQHGGPPAALLGHEIESRAGARADMRVARISIDILRPVPIGIVTVATRVVHASRSVEIVDATLCTDDGRTVMRASAVRIRVADDPMPEHRASAPPPPTDAAELPDTLTDFRFDVGYHTGMETRYATGSFEATGPATVWFRMRRPLVAGEPTLPLSRVLIAADSGNGISHVIDFRSHIFVNPEMTVHLHRYPDGEYVCLDSATTTDIGGIGLADTVLFDEVGPIGRGTQALFIGPRR